jgi:hypothetical protein
MSPVTQISLSPAQVAAMTRWKRGHQSFHLQLTVINTLIEDSLEAVEAGEHPRLVRSLRLLCVLYDAATASMKYASDFPRELYVEFVRPSMMPPFLSPGFSGVLNTEHNRMVEGLKQLTRAMSQKLGGRADWRPDVADAWKALGEAHARNQSNHSLVCHKFVDAGTSLLKQFYMGKKKLLET